MAASAFVLQVIVLILALHSGRSSGSAFVRKELRGSPRGHAYEDDVSSLWGLVNPRQLLQARNTPTRLIKAAVSGQGSLVESIIAAGVRVDAINSVGWTALTAASIANQPDTARILIENGADLNHKAAGGMTPLMAASMQGNRGMIELLLKSGAEKGVQASGETAEDLVCSCTTHTVGLIAKHCNVRECEDMEKLVAVFDVA